MASAEIKIELPIDANLPESYVERADVRLDAYRRLAEVQSLADVDDIEEEWNDRFGAIPEVAQRLLGIARIRAECVRTGLPAEVPVLDGVWSVAMGAAAQLSIAERRPVELAEFGLTPQFR